jgi:hypothetical protein
LPRDAVVGIPGGSEIKEVTSAKIVKSSSENSAKTATLIGDAL